MLHNLRRKPALYVFVGTAALTPIAFAPEPVTTDRSSLSEERQFAQAKAKAKSNAQKAKGKANEGDNAKGGSTGQCPPGKTFTPGRGRGVGATGQCS